VSEQLIDLLKFGLLGLLYLFFVRVIWAVWTELRAPAVETSGSGRAGGARRAKGEPRNAKPSGRGGRRHSPPRALRVAEPPELAGTEYPIAAEMTLGRAPGCTIVVDDTYVSQVHCRVFIDGDELRVEDLGSTNGTLLNRSNVTGPQPIQIGDHVQVGNVVLELVR